MCIEGPPAHPNKTPILGSQRGTRSSHAILCLFPAPQTWGFIGVGGGDSLSLFICLALLLLPLPSVRAGPLPPSVPLQAAAQNDDVKPPVVTPQMLRYSRTRYALYFVGTAYGLLALWGVLASGLSARLRRLVQPLRFSFFRLLGYYALLTLALVIIHAPLTFYSGYYLEHAYGLSSQSLPAWLGDEAKSVVVGHREPLFLFCGCCSG